MKITMYELLGLVKDEPDRSIYVKYFDRVNKKENVMWACKENIIYKLEQLVIKLNDEVEIIEEEKKIPEKLSTWFSVETKQSKELNIEYANTNFENMYEKINSIIDYLKSKGE